MLVVVRMAYLGNHTSVLLGPRVFFYRDRREKLSLAHQCANFGAQINWSPGNFISDFCYVLSLPYDVGPARGFLGRGLCGFGPACVVLALHRGSSPQYV